jgi:hypothetical protein
MQMTFQVVSRVVPAIPLTLIQVEAPGFRIGKRWALGVARKQGIPKPAVFDREAFEAIKREQFRLERAEALRTREYVRSVERALVWSTPLNGTSKAYSCLPDNEYEPYSFD